MRLRALTLALTSLALASGCGGGFDNSAPEKPSGPATFARYVALGDGFASGPYLGKDSSGNGCLRSADNYPAQVARTLKVAQVTDVTCVAATTASLTSPSRAPGSKTRLAPQLDAVTKDTDLVTIGIGIEDDGLLQKMFHICEALPCGSDVVATDLAKQLDSYGVAISSAVRTIQDIAPTATIVVVGYPRIMPSSGLCKALPAVSETQLGYASKILDQVNTLLRAAAFQTGSQYVDVAELSQDRTACAQDPWVSGSTTKKGLRQGFHPVAAEQQAVAAAVADQIRLASSSDR
ncbi:MAG: SGNH/GDSL hydrolase family protein [Propionibacteriales bacterium]|nr:SGNH/GDSL hydrolase family protein [Propionibacteriales bacterium]